MYVTLSQKFDLDHTLDVERARCYFPGFEFLPKGHRMGGLVPTLFIYDNYCVPKNARLFYDFMLDRNFRELYVNENLLGYNPGGEGSFFISVGEMEILPAHSEDTMDICIYVHNRKDFFKLSLDSLLYATKETPVIIHVFMSRPTDDVKNYCESLGKSISLYSTENNIAYGCFNLFLQHVKPDAFIVFEDDFILPQKTKHLFPHWPSRIKRSLLDNKATSLHFETSIENLPYDFINRPKQHQVDPKIHHNYLSTTPGGTEPRITGNGMALLTDNYLKYSELKPPFYITPDGDVARNSTSLYTLGITGYHLGFNQEMHVNQLYTDHSRFPQPNDEQRLYDYQRDAMFTYNLSEVKKLMF